MRTASTLVAIAALAITPAAEAASTGNWILNGSSVEYKGTNQLRIGYGTVVAGGSNYQVTATGINTATPTSVIWASSSTTNCPTNTTSLQGASTAYYLYYEGSASTFVASGVAPLETGIPSGSLYTKSGTTCTANAASLYTFLGSFITDSNSNVVPFERHGEHVLLNFPAGTNPKASFKWTSPSAQSVTMTGVVYPLTAAALTLEVQSDNEDTTYNHYAYISDANNGSVNGTTCVAGTGSPLGLVWAGNAYPFTLVQERIDYPTSLTASSTIEMSVCDFNFGTDDNHHGLSFTLTARYYGYVEPVAYLNQIR